MVSLTHFVSHFLFFIQINVVLVIVFNVDCFLHTHFFGLSNELVNFRLPLIASI